MTSISKKNFQVNNVFGLTDVPDGVVIEGRESSSVFVPKADTYTFRKDDIRLLGAWMKIDNGDGLYLTGPTGSGKTSLINQFCSRLNIPLQQVTAHGRLETPELIGHQTVIGGDLVFQDGPLTTALRHGHWFLLNEADLLDPATAAGLNDVLEGQPLTIPDNGGEIVRPHPDFRFIATGNTNGGGDQDGLYMGTTQQNLAFMDRFLLMEVNYMDKETEVAVLESKVPEIPRDIIEMMVDVANHIRNLFMGNSSDGDAIEVTMSTRTLVRWAQLTLFSSAKASENQSPAEYAIKPALGYRASPETSAALVEIVQRYFSGGSNGRS